MLLASMGSHVPATHCRLGHRRHPHASARRTTWLTRQSTFMLEMVEAAQILHAATPLPGADGRDRTRHQHFDGSALASGIATHLHDKTRAFTLFATHQELTELPAKARHAVNMHVSAAESGRHRLSCIEPGPGQPQLRHPGY